MFNVVRVASKIHLDKRVEGCVISIGPLHTREEVRIVVGALKHTVVQESTSFFILDSGTFSHLSEVIKLSCVDDGWGHSLHGFTRHVAGENIGVAFPLGTSEHLVKLSGDGSKAIPLKVSEILTRFGEVNIIDLGYLQELELSLPSLVVFGE